MAGNNIQSLVAVKAIKGFLLSSDPENQLTFKISNYTAVTLVELVGHGIVCPPAASNNGDLHDSLNQP
ncbi:hypothetical protein K08M3_49780 [Vibrio alginolyticus]|jgi:hypothetical protein|uniref:Uncharacterized protein n=1 Tax=Vibrio alginolyticus TaxID=663 RepID=A0A1W6V993_VIBAL|nr:MULTISPECIES: hypothetical protein [Vibrio harveyi group]ARP06488.1 hypothetical protein K04M1_49650 [Vibrio alginolyticus]ARP11593.1 hypothetical protein K04M3_50240 [Vibrio alginolyticus]ARP16674.1 hypothetical protein K04M5_50220 [Vibrio alginolyticus]ARP21693.1 hypothetical protein K05K4_49840 [Vibrio alginolyticus]ARP26774.1 hypothetical protein K06K5_49740 [Vibrio alginolyticus]